jgi:hypothetical protein
MTVKNYTVKQVSRNEVRDFIEKWHYSNSINGVMGSYYFGLYDNDKLIGAMIYGNLGMANAWKKYSDKAEKILELRRLCCIDDTPKNTESYFIGKTLRMLKQINKKLEIIVSYADTNYNHTGTIYKASNFKYLGKTAKGKVIIRKSDNKIYHDKAIRTKYKGKLKPFAAKLKEQLESGEAYYKETKGKNIYLYNLK